MGKKLLFVSFSRNLSTLFGLFFEKKNILFGNTYHRRVAFVAITSSCYVRGDPEFITSDLPSGCYRAGACEYTRRNSSKWMLPGRGLRIHSTELNKSHELPCVPHSGCGKRIVERLSLFIEWAPGLAFLQIVASCDIIPC